MSEHATIINSSKLEVFVLLLDSHSSAFTHSATDCVLFIFAKDR